MIRTLIRVITKIWKPLFFIIGFALIIAFAIAWIGSIIGLFYAFPFIAYLYPGQSVPTVLGALNLLFLIGIPLVSLVLLITRLLYGTRLNSKWKAGLGAFWALNMFSLFFVGSLIGKQFSSGTEVSQGIDMNGISGDTLSISLGENPYKHLWLHIGDDLQVSEDKLVSQNIFFSIKKSETDHFELVQENFSRGANLSEAKQLANAINLEISIADGKMLIPPIFTILKGGKWRNQKVYLSLKIPVGKSVRLTDNIHRIIRDVDLDDRHNPPWSNRDKVWRMESTGLVCLDCPGNKTN